MRPQCTHSGCIHLPRFGPPLPASGRYRAIGPVPEAAKCGTPQSWLCESEHTQRCGAEYILEEHTLVIEEDGVVVPLHHVGVVVRLARRLRINDEVISSTRLHRAGGLG